MEDVAFEEEQQAPRIMSFSQPTTHIQEEYESPLEARPNQVSVSPLMNEHSLTAKMQNTQLARRGLFVDIFPSSQITRFSSPYSAEEIFQRLSESFHEFLVPCKMTGPSKVSCLWKLHVLIIVWLVLDGLYYCG